MKRLWGVLVAASVLMTVACREPPAFDPKNPALGPGGLVGNDGPITDGHFAGGNDVLPEPRAVAPPDDSRPPDCDEACISYCAAANLENPVNKGLCRSLWGVGLASRPIDDAEACRRLFVDLVGRLPSSEEMTSVCTGSWGETAKRLIDDPQFVFINQRRAADKFLYANEVVNIQRIYDMDELTGKLYRGLIPYDLYAAVVSAHPILTRRVADSRDTVEALFDHFLGRPPFENERADMARLYDVWTDGYYDHPTLNIRLPDAFLRYPCVGEDGEINPALKGQCTSVLWGYNELLMEPDFRSSMDRRQRELTMWSGLMRPEEWAQTQLPGKILGRDMAFWERAVEEVAVQYLGYNLVLQVPEVRQELVKHLLRYNGDMRSVHFALATSVAYLQSNAGTSSSNYRWTWGPMKQLDAEVWIDSLAKLSGYQTSSCDHRISQPEAFIQSGSLSGYRLIQNSGWSFDEDGELDESYSDVARTLGGCPENVIGGRFKVVSILTTATQLNFVNQLCNPSRDPEISGAAASRLLPAGMDPRKAVNSEVAGEIGTHQYRLLLGHTPTVEELGEVKAGGEECALGRCTAEEFARPLCFALLSSAEMIFY